MVISMIAAYVGANFLGPALISAAGVAKIPLACMAIKSSAAVICSKFMVSFAATGRLDAALKSVFSLDTVLCAATNVLMNYAVEGLAKLLGI